jgi:hypothetical protein
MDDSRARLVLATVPGFDMTQVWFATGSEYWSSGSCLDGRDIYAFTKPQLSSPGVWRGKKLYVSQPTLDSNAKCADPDAFRYDHDSTITTVTFTDPGQLQLDEAWDGAEPGLFEVRGDIGDDDLRKIVGTMEHVRMCLKRQATCDYPIDHDDLMHWTDRELAAAIDPEKLLSLGPGFDFKPNDPCYSMVFEISAWGGAFGMGICYQGEVVSKVDVGGMVIE